MTSKKFRMQTLTISLTVFLAAILVISPTAQSTYAGNGNPMPGVPHDTIMIHFQDKKDNGGKSECDGGHALHIGIERDPQTGEVTHVPGVEVHFSMTDWEQIDNDKDGVFDEDGPDGIDNDGDGAVDEDPKEPGNKTQAIDCDTRWDKEGEESVSMLIRDTDPRKGWISIQKWWLRLVGQPDQAFVFNTYGQYTIDCTGLADTQVDNDGDGLLNEDPADGFDNDGDGLVDEDPIEYECNYSDWIPIAEYSLTGDTNEKCVNSYKSTGKGKQGKTEFCDVTDALEVDVDVDGDGFYDFFSTSIFTLSCDAEPIPLVDEDPIDGFDNDGDGLVDEDPPEGIDNDGDGLVDEDPIDGIDNDGDGLVDEDSPNDDGDTAEGTDVCPLGESIWKIDEKTGRPTVQLFLSHYDSDQVKQTQKGNTKVKGSNKP